MLNLKRALRTLFRSPLVTIVAVVSLALGMGASMGFSRCSTYWVYTFARLKPGVSLDQAKTAINVPYRQIVSDVEAPLQQGMSDQTMAKFKAKGVEIEDGWRGQSSVHGEARTPLLLLLGVTALVLLIACANIANLLLARVAGRANEMAIRLSLGARRLQLVSQLLVESCLLALLGGAAGMLVARWTIDFITSVLPDDATTTLSSTLDTNVLLFAGGLTIGTWLLSGLFPALHSTRPDLVSTLKSQAGQPSGARSAQRFRTTLATAQIALSMTLLACAGLFTKSLLNVSRVDLGIKVENVVTFAISPELNVYKSARSRQLFERLEDELAALAGVTGVTTALVPLLAGNNWGSDVQVQGFPIRTGHRQRVPLQRSRPRLLPHDGRAAHRGPRVHARRRPGLAEGHGRQRGVREEVQPRARCRRQTHGRRPQGRGHGHRDHRPGAERQVQRGQARGSAALLPAVPARTTQSAR